MTRPSHPLLIDAVFFQYNRSGIARVWRSLLAAWVKDGYARKIVVLDRAGTAPRIPGIRYRDIPAHSYAAMDADRTMLQRVCDEEKASLFISTFYTTPITTPSAFMAYDMIPELLKWDPAITPMCKMKQIGITHAQVHIAISQNTATDLCRFFPTVAKDRVFVSYCGVDFVTPPPEKVAAFKTLQAIEKPYFLLVGHRASYKNAVLFFQAFAAMGEQRQHYEVVCTGPWGTLEPEFSACLGPAPVRMIEVDDDKLQCAYAGAIALVYPSRFEGFGMPIAEAMACSCPVITCAGGSIPEVAGDAAIFVGADDVSAMLQALTLVQQPNVRATLIAQGRERAARFSWQRMANEVKAILENAVQADSTEGAVVTNNVLTRIIPGEIVNDEFYTSLHTLAGRADLKTFLEIGSSSGTGSTQAFVSALRERPDANETRLFCMELSRERFRALAAAYANDSFVKCYNQSSVALQEFPGEEAVRFFYNQARTTLNQYPIEQVLSWLKADTEYMQQSGLTQSGIEIIKSENRIQHFDMVLIDGSEFTGEAELCHVLGARVIALDDVNSHKCFNVYQMLGHNVAYALTQQNLQVRNGYAIFQRRY